MSKSDIIKKYLKDYPDLSKNGVAKLIFKENPNVWDTLNGVRKLIQYYQGCNGSDDREKREKQEEKVETGMLESQFSLDKHPLLKKISEMYTPAELQSIANGTGITAKQNATLVDFEGDHIRIGLLADTHIGSKYFNKQELFQAFEEFKKEKVDFICHAGDVTEGMSNRPGQIYELDQLGYDQQRREAVDIFSKWDGKIYMIDGNHDRWFIKSNGALIVKDICEMLPNATFLGHDEGDINLGGRAIIKLWHGEDSSSYATSYRIQKVVESFTGGEKPSLLLLGHVHKAVYVFERNIHCYGAGCIEKQSKWMRAKRISAHTGFWIIDIWVGERGITKSQGCFYPFFS